MPPFYDEENQALADHIGSLDPPLPEDYTKGASMPQLQPDKSGDERTEGVPTMGHAGAGVAVEMTGNTSDLDCRSHVFLLGGGGG